MSDKSAISWCDATWNPICGCSKISAGCLNCYAEKAAFRLGGMEKHRWTYGRVVNHCGDYEFRRQWNGSTEFIESALTKPLHWRKPRKIFVCSMSDLFHKSVPFEWVLKVLGIIIATPWHTYYFLTKRPKRMYEFFAPYPDGWLIREGMKYSSFSYEFFAINAIKDIVPDAMIRKANEYWKANYDQSKRGKLDGPVPHPIPNLHLGVTVENTKEAWRLGQLRMTPAAARFISLEPWLPTLDAMALNLRKGEVDYAFIGCESGPDARLCTLDNIRYVMQQCREAGVKIHVKQLPIDGECNKNFNEWPKEFQVREV